MHPPSRIKWFKILKVLRGRLLTSAKVLDTQIADRNHSVSNRNDLQSHRASEVTPKNRLQSVEKRVDIATDITVIRIAAISNRSQETWAQE